MMETLIDTLNRWAAPWLQWAAGNLVGGSVVLAVVFLLWWGLRRNAAPALGYWLFMLVLIKPLVPVHIAVPQAWFPSPTTTEAPIASVPAAPLFVATGAPIPLGAPAALAPSAVGSSAAKAPSPTWQAWLLGAWFLIVAVLFLRLAWVQRRARRWLRDAVPLSQQQGELNALAAELGLRKAAPIFSHAEVDTPLVFGLWCPKLVVPPQFFAELDREQRRWVLLHELAHIKRRDLWMLSLQRMVCILQFFNPAVWIAARCTNRLREFACDDLALLHSRADRRTCGEGFVRIVEGARRDPLPGGAALALFGRRSDSQRRLARILDSRRRLASNIGRGGITLLALVAPLALPTLRAEDPAKDTAPALADEASGKRIATKFVEIDQTAPPPPTDEADADADATSGDLFDVLPKRVRRNRDQLRLRMTPEGIVELGARGKAKQHSRESLRRSLLAASKQQGRAFAVELIVPPDVEVAKLTETLNLLAGMRIETNITVRKGAPALGSLFSDNDESIERPQPAAPEAAADEPAPPPGLDDLFSDDPKPADDTLAPPVPAPLGSPTDPHASVPLLGDLAHPVPEGPAALAPLDPPLAKEHRPALRLALPTSGIVSEVLVKNGQRVEKGELLVRIDNRQALAELRVAQAKLKSAEVMVQSAKQAYEIADAQFRAGQQTEEAPVTRRGHLTQAEANLAVMIAEYEQAQVALELYQLRAPAAGVVREIGARPGEYTSPTKGSLITLELSE